MIYNYVRTKKTTTKAVESLQSNKRISPQTFQMKRSGTSQEPSKPRCKFVCERGKPTTLGGCKLEKKRHISG